MDALLETIVSRRSIRRYQPTSVDRALVQRLLEAAVWGPSAHNRQPWRFCVVDAPERKETLARAMGARLRADLERDGAPADLIEKDAARSYQRITGAPVVVILCLTMSDMDSYSDERRSLNEYLMAAQSTAMAGQNLLLAAHQAGLAACWMCAPLFCPDVVRDVLDAAGRLAGAGVDSRLVMRRDARKNAPSSRNERPMALETKNVVVLVGGVGGAKLAHGLAQILPPDKLTVIVNTADDFWHYGLRVCPDLDTVTYTLSGLVDKGQRLGRRRRFLRHARRSQAIRRRRLVQAGRSGHGDAPAANAGAFEGDSLTTVTQKLTNALGIAHTILPMTDAQVCTIVNTVEHGDLDFQVYFVRHRWQPTVRSIRFDGIEGASVSPEAQRAIAAADVILFGPSNPWLSIAPILAVPGMRDR